MPSSAGNRPRPGEITALRVLAVLGLPLVAVGLISGAVAWLALPLLSGQLVFLYGAWRLRKWAWYLGVLLNVAALALSIITSHAGRPLLLALLSSGVPLVTLYLLLCADVRLVFGIGNAG